MNYYSTNRRAAEASLKEAVVRGLAPDRGLYMPGRIERLPESFFREMPGLSFVQIACRVAEAFFGEDVDADALRRIVTDTLSFDAPVVRVEDRVWSLELFHGPTLAFKDVGGRFMARMLSYFLGRGGDRVTVLVATSGDTGSAVANGFLDVEGIDVVVLYPKGKVSEIQEKQFTTLGRNITALEIDGTFDDCQRLVKELFADAKFRAGHRVSSANSINLLRWIPQAFYYFYGYCLWRQQTGSGRPVVVVPSGNYGNLSAGMLARRMGLPLGGFVAASNSNDVVPEFLRSGEYQ